MVKRRTVGCLGCVLVAGLLLVGCTPDSGSSPTAAPTPAVSSPTASPTPTENAQERQQRMDFEAAEKAYLTASREKAKLAMAGGASTPTEILLATTGGFYLKVQMQDLKTLKENGWRADRPPTTTVSRSGGWSAEELDLTACEDASEVRLLAKDGKEAAKDRSKRFVQSLTATKKSGVWRITDGESRVVDSFADESACTG